MSHQAGKKSKRFQIMQRSIKIRIDCPAGRIYKHAPVTCNIPLQANEFEFDYKLQLIDSSAKVLPLQSRAPGHPNATAGSIGRLSTDNLVNTGKDNG
jgi:hypothetical protein